MAESRNRADRHNPDEGKGTPQPPSSSGRSDAASAGPARARGRQSAKRGRSERFAALNAFVDMGMANLTGAEVKVWLILYRDTKGTGTARTGQADIARRAGLRPRMVRYALAKLEAKGMVHVLNRGRLNVGPSVYRVHPTGTA